MPWIVLPNGEQVYKVSLYAKEELPTWNEVYSEFFLSGLCFYNPDEQNQEMDPYWKIPRSKVRIATVCNQLNKMLYEDGYRARFLEHFSKDRGEWGPFEDIKFLIEPLPDYLDKMKDAQNDDEAKKIYEEHLKVWTAFLDSKFIGLNCPPPIYTIPNPNGTPNPFITNEHPRVDITTLEGKLIVCPVLKAYNGTTDTVNSAIEVYCQMDDDPYQRRMYKDIVAFMMRTFRDYFEGGVGWKDTNGNHVPSQPIEKPFGDPAL
ncbi:MAG: hypothetical protein NC131_11160 [Roseburia sp.]|nr:hypothetical protein [Roseburia sp.]